MKKFIYILFSMAVLTAANVSSQGTDSAGADTVSSATVKGTGWKIVLKGVRGDELYQSQYDSWKESDGMYREVKLERKGKVRLYGGIPLKDVVAVVDDPSGGYPFTFQKDLWEKGYEITLTASDGYSFTFSTSEVPYDGVFLVDSVDGKSVPPMIAGKINSKAWVKNLSEIELSLAPVVLENNSFEFVLDVNGKSASYTIKELEAMPIYVEDKGQYTNSYGNTFSGIYGGVKLVPLLSQFMEVTPDTNIKVIAMDGYEMDYSGSMLLDQSDGDWILAFKENGEYMPEDPGYIRLLKVGPKNPNIDGHASARMIKKIVTSGTPFKDFRITVFEKGKTESFDRQDFQSGVMANKNRVMYHNRKSNSDIPYMGIALWRFLERISGYSAVKVEASDGFSVTLENSQIEKNDDVILAMYTGKDDELLPPSYWPLILVWDKDASVIPEGIKAVRNVVKISLIY